MPKPFPVKSAFIRPLKYKNGKLKPESSDSSLRNTMRSFSRDGYYTILAHGTHELWHLKSTYGRPGSSAGRREYTYIDHSDPAYLDKKRSSIFIDIEHIDKLHRTRHYVDNFTMSIPSTNVLSELIMSDTYTDKDYKESIIDEENVGEKEYVEDNVVDIQIMEEQEQCKEEYRHHEQHRQGEPLHKERIEGTGEHIQQYLQTITEKPRQKEMMDAEEIEEQRRREEEIEEQRRREEEIEEQRRQEEKIEEQRRQEEEIEEQRRQEEKIEEQRRQEEEIEEQRRQEEKIEEQRRQEEEIEEQRRQEEKIEEQRRQEEEIEEQRRQEEEIEEQHRQEEKIEEQRRQEEKMEEQRRQEEKIEGERRQEEKMEEQRRQEEKIEEERRQEEKIEEERRQEEKMEEERRQEEKIEEERRQEEEQTRIYRERTNDIFKESTFWHSDLMSQKDFQEVLTPMQQQLNNMENRIVGLMTVSNPEAEINNIFQPVLQQFCDFEISLVKSISRLDKINRRMCHLHDVVKNLRDDSLVVYILKNSAEARYLVSLLVK